MHLLIICFLLVTIRAQQDPCLCSCCSGLSCNPISLPTIYVENCSLQKCIAQCRSTYPQCREDQPSSLISAQCQTSVVPKHNCQCHCCNTGAPSCLPTYVGSTFSYICNAESCSITCSNQYTNICVANHIGQTLGICTSSSTITSALSTTTTTTRNPSFANTCSCMCCNTGSSCSAFYVGTSTAYVCSFDACTLACKNQYPALCPAASNFGQTIGTCISSTGANIICKCSCCGTHDCKNYEVITYAGCSECDSMCRKASTCTKPENVMYTCHRNDAKSMLPRLALIFIMLFLYLLIRIK